MKIVKSLFLTSLLLFFFNSSSAQLEWVKFSGEVPWNAVIGGLEDVRSLPVCRCSYNGAMHPGKVVDKNCNIGYGGAEKSVSSFEVLVNQGVVELEWLNVENSLPDHAVQAGSENGLLLYVGRASHEKGTHPGKIFKAGNNYICNIGYGGKEITSTSFEVLVEVRNANKVSVNKVVSDDRCKKDSYIAAKGIGKLSKDNKMPEGSSLISKNLKYQTRVTDDGRLVVEEVLDYLFCDNGTILIVNSKEVWSNTATKGDAVKEYYLKFQEDGNLCIYHGENSFVWCSMSNGNDSDHFEITNIGHIEVVNSHGVEVWPN